MKSLFVLIAILHLLIQSINLSQEQKRERNFAYLELGGNQILYSLNYETQLAKNTNLRFGGSVLPIKNNSNSNKSISPYILLTLMANQFINLKNNHYLEIGGGMTLGLDEINPAFTLGYRYIPIDNSMFIKIAYTPILGYNPDFTTWFGIGIGYKF